MDNREADKQIGTLDSIESDWQITDWCINLHDRQTEIEKYDWERKEICSQIDI